MVEVIETSISTGYTQNWGPTEAIREILQNWLDVTTTGVRGEVTWSNGTAHIKDYGSGLEMRHLALGVSEKAPGSKGHFGEGLKLGLLVLARMGRKAEIWTHGKRITPIITHSKAFDVDVLAFRIEPLPARMRATHTGTSIKVQCNKHELQDAKDYFVEFAPKRRTSSRKSIEWVDKENGILLPAGGVYLNGSMIGRIDGAAFSYSIRSYGNEGIGNRDRDAIDMNVVAPKILRIVMATHSMKVRRTLLRNAYCWERKHFEPNAASQDALGRKLWVKASTMTFGTAVIDMEDDPAATAQAKHLKIDTIRPFSVGLSWATFLRDCGVRTVDTVLRSERVKQHVVQPKSLAKVEQDNLEWAKAEVAKHYADPNPIILVEKLEVGGSSLDGEYSPSEKVTRLVRRILTDRKATLHTLLHETCHKVSGETDCTTEFERALLDISVGIIVGK